PRSRNVLPQARRAHGRGKRWSIAWASTVAVAWGRRRPDPLELGIQRPERQRSSPRPSRSQPWPRPPWLNPPTELTLVGPTDPTERVTGVYCQGPTVCVVTTEASEEGHLYATDGQAITATVITSDYDLGEAFGVLGTVELMGVARVGDTVVVLVDGAASSLLTNTGDVTDPGSWQRSALGLPEGRDSFGGNQQVGLGTDGSGWTLFLRSMIYTGDDPPGLGAIWYETWAPVPPGERPNDIAQRAREDPT